MWPRLDQSDCKILSMRDIIHNMVAQRRAGGGGGVSEHISIFWGSQQFEYLADRYWEGEGQLFGSPITNCFLFFCFFLFFKGGGGVPPKHTHKQKVKVGGGGFNPQRPPPPCVRAWLRMYELSVCRRGCTWCMSCVIIHLAYKGTL